MDKGESNMRSAGGSRVVGKANGDQVQELAITYVVLKLYTPSWMTPIAVDGHHIL